MSPPPFEWTEGGRPCVYAVTAGRCHTCALYACKSFDGSSAVKCWGCNERGQLGLGDATARGLSEGTLPVAYPPAQLGQPASGLVAISAGGCHTCALWQGGGVKCW